MKPAYPNLILSPAEIEWTATSSESLEPQHVHVSAEGGEWKVASCPWWIEARREGDALTLRVRHCGGHRGKVQIVSHGEIGIIRVRAHVGAAREHALAAKRRAQLAALLLASPLFALFVLVFSLRGYALQQAEKWFYLLFACWVPLAAAGLGWSLGSWKLALRTALGTGAGVVILSGVIAAEYDFMPRGGLLPLPGYHVPHGYYSGALGFLNSWPHSSLELAQMAILAPPHLALFWASWGAVTGGGWLARQSAVWGTLWSVCLVVPATLTGYGMFVAVPFAVVLVTIVWQRTLAGLLARIPSRDGEAPLLARSAPDGWWLRWTAASLAVLVIGGWYRESVTESFMNLLRRLGIWF